MAKKLEDWVPFHVSVLRLIKWMDLGSMTTTGELIKTTAIPEGWDEIAEAWRLRKSELMPESACAIDDGVQTALIEHKRLLDKKREADRYQDELEANFK